MGTMAQAEKKSTRIFCIVASVILSIVVLMIYANLFKTYFYDWHKRADGWKWLSIIPFALSYFSLWKLSGHTWGERGAKNHGIIVAICFVLGILVACGFNFDMRGIIER